MELKTVLTDITKTLEIPSSLAIAEKIINFYHQHYYNGTEYEKVSLMYFDRVLLELAFWVGTNMHYIKQNEIELSKLNKFFNKHILEARINTYSRRKKLYWHWLGKNNNECPENNEILSYLRKNYKVCESNYEQVKQELDLVIKEDNLIDRLKRMK